MNSRPSEEIRKILTAAAEESRKLHHGYVGTEHILLALLSHPPTVQILQRFQITPEQIHSEIASLIQPGSASADTPNPPLTDRAKYALDIAAAEAGFANQRQTDPSQLLLGLFSAFGVAGVTLRSLNDALTVELLREQVFRIRLAQLRLIERTVRPVQAGTPRKLKMREELLAHLESIYAEELARTQNPDTALAAAAHRFGNPADLTRELQSTVPAHERLSWHLERRFGWRAPEHASKYLLRFTLQFLAFFGILFTIFAAVVVAIDGLIPDAISILYPALLALVATAASLYLLGNLYFLTRDALFGVFGSPKSKSRLALLAAATFATTFAIGAGYITASAGSIRDLPQAFASLALAAGILTVFSLLHARFGGPREIQQTHWESLNLDTN